MDTLDLQVFITAVSAGSLAAAGRQLGISAMATSRALAALEQQLGVRLMHRTTRAISLTPEGEEFLPYARSMLELSSAASDAVAPSAQGVTGTLKVTCPHLFGRVVVMPLVERLLADNPRLKIDLILNDSLVDIVESGIDLAIRMARINDSGLAGRQLAPNPRVLCAAPRYLQRFGKPECLADLQHHECLSLPHQRLWPFRVAGEVRRVKVSGRFACTSAEGNRSACLQGIGITLMTRWGIEEEIALGDLEVIELADATPDDLPLWALMPGSRHVPRRVRVFLDALVERLQQ